MLAVLLDQFQRPLRNLRLSVTDRCNLRCSYCMPEQDYVWLPREDILQFEEIERLVDVFLELGVDKVRLTGGEPLLRRDLPALVARARRAAADPRPRDDDQRRPAGRARARARTRRGCTALTVSLDTLRPERFRELTRSDELDRVLEGIAAAAPLFPRLKIDTVVIRGTNDDELVDLIEFGRRYGAEVRFIEYMDVGGATHWSMERVVSRAEMLAASGAPLRSDRAGRRKRPRRRPIAIACRTARSSASLRRRREPFCEDCDRSRLTADGMWYLCLYASRGIDLRAALRGGRGAGAGGADSVRVDGASRPRRRRPARGARPRAAHSARYAAPRSAPRDAHAGWVTGATS